VSAVLVGSVETPDPLTCEGTVVWTYRYTACDGTSADWTYTYTVDYTSALLPPANGSSTVECPADAVDPGAPADITDGCGRTVSAVLVGSVETPDPLTCEGTVVWTYRYTACDGTSADWTYTYTVDYTSALLPPANGSSTVECPADAVDPGAPADITDGCGRTVSAVLVGSVETPDPLTCEGTVVWTYRYTACDGTSADWTYTYTVDYTSALLPPANGSSTVECLSAAVDPGAPADITDGCGRTVSAVLVGSVETPDPLTCEGTVVWTYRYTACDGTSADWTYTYTVDYTSALLPPANGSSTVECPADAVDPGAPADITDGCGRTVSAVLVGSVETPDPLTCEGTVVWTYRYTACDGTSADWTYTYTVDYTSALLPPANGSSTVECLSAAVDPGAPADITDGCGRTVSAVLVGSVETPDPLTCEGTVVWTYRYTACDGTSADWTYTYTVDYTSALLPPANGSSTVECPADAVDPGAPADITDGCGRTVSAVLVGSVETPDPLTCEGTVVWTYRYTACDGTSADWTYTYTVDDVTPPVAVCQDITVQLDATGNATIVAADVDGGSSDNCTAALTMSLDVTTFDCSDLGPNAVTLTVEDACGNQSSCVATVTVEDNLPPSITCQVDVAVTAPAGDCSVPVNGIEPAAIGDNCGGSVVSYRLEGATTGFGLDDASGTAFNKGVTTVWYIITDSNNNADSCSFDVTVATTVVPPDQASSDRTEVCPGDGDIVLSYTGGVMPEGGVAHWYDDAGLTNIIGDGNNLSVPAPVVTSTYYVRFEGDCDTTAAVSTTVTIKSLTVDPVSASVDRSEVCAGDGNIILSYAGGDLGSNGVAVWYDDAGFTSSVGTGNNLSIAAPSDTTIYYVRFEADCDTSAAVSVEVDVWPTPAPTFEEKYEIACTNGPLYRYVAGGFAGSTFNWVIVGGTIVDDFNDTIYVDWGDVELTGSLELTEISVDGCISAPVTIEVAVGGPDLDLGDDVGVCRGSSVTIAPEGTFASYLWQDGSTAGSYTTGQEGWVVLEVTDNNGCAARDSVFVTVWELPVVDLGPDTTLCGEGELLLDAGPDGISYRWSTGEGSQQILVRMGDPEEIWVEVENEYGCISGDTVNVESCPLEFISEIFPRPLPLVMEMG
jgi:hypothetical protein